MRVAYVNADPGVPVFGSKGCSIHVQGVIRSLQKTDFAVDLYTCRRGGKASEDLQAVPVFKLPYSAKQVQALREKLAFASNSALTSMLQHHGPYDLVYERYSLWSFAGMEYARSRGIPGVLEVNSPLIEEQQHYRMLANPTQAERVARRVFKAAHTIIAVSEGVAEYLENFKGEHAHVHVFANGVNPDWYPPDLKPSRPVNPDVFTVGFVGSLKPWHGLNCLIEAFSRLMDIKPDAELLIVGDGPQRDIILEEITQRGLNKAVHLTGAVPPKDVPGLLASMDTAVAPYPAQKGFYFSPLKVYEYMAAGLPVVASRIGQLADVIHHGVNGYLCPPGEPGTLLKLLHHLSVDKELRNRIGTMARSDVLQRFTWDRIVRGILDLSGVFYQKQEGGCSHVPA